MTAVTSPTSQRTQEGPRPTSSSPVLLWATMGVLCLVVVLTGWARWITSNDFVPTSHGPDPISTPYLVILRIVEVASLLGAAVITVIYLVRPVLRERRLNLDGMMIIALTLAWFWDPTANYLNYSFAYNNYAWNYGSWVRFIPGWEYPGAPGNFVEPVWVAGAWIWWCFGGAVLMCAFLRKLRARRPNWSTLRLFVVLAGIVVVADLLLESVFLRTQVMCWPGAPASVTLWSGHFYRFPLPESLLVISLMFGITAVRYFKDDRGRSFVEKGVDNLRVPRHTKALISLCAVIGFLHFWVIVGYNLPLQIVSVKADTFPPMPSYLRSLVCGTGTDYACPSGAVPVPGRGSLHITPTDPRLPASVRDQQGTRP